MTPSNTSKQTEAVEKTESTDKVEAATSPTNAANVKKAVALGKDMKKQNPEVSKADVARAMYELIREESREVIVQAFIDGASLTPKGAQTYFYNCKRKMKKGS